MPYNVNILMVKFYDFFSEEIVECSVRLEGTESKSFNCFAWEIYCATGFCRFLLEIERGAGWFCFG